MKPKTQTGDPQSSSSAAKAVGRFLAVRKQSETLAQPLTPEDMAIQSMPDVSPTKWHLAHTSWFFETFILKEFDPGYRVFDENFNYLFNSYYEAVGQRHPRPKRGMITRPDVAEVLNYRAHITEATADLAAKNPDPELLALLELGCNHEEQHQELILTDIKHVLYQNPLRPAYSEAPPGKAKQPATLSWQALDEGVYEIGFAGGGFCYDNETPRHKVYLNGFQMASRPITNGEYLEFIRDGAYGAAELWLCDGWNFILENKLEAPLYWRKAGDGWLEFTLRGEHPLNPGSPVCHLTYYEAEAFARWAGARLPTEAEHETWARAGDNNEAGEVWEWTGSAYLPYPGFKPAKGAVGEYNGKFMCSQMVLRGGSGATPGGHWRPTYRNFFYPHQAWQFSGLRLAKDK